MEKLQGRAGAAREGWAVPGEQSNGADGPASSLPAATLGARPWQAREGLPVRGQAARHGGPPHPSSDPLAGARCVIVLPVLLLIGCLRAAKDACAHSGADVHGSAGLILNAPSATARVKSPSCLPDSAGALGSPHTAAHAHRVTASVGGGRSDAGCHSCMQAPLRRRCCTRAARKPPSSCTCCTATPPSLTRLRS